MTTPEQLISESMADRREAMLLEREKLRFDLAIEKLTAERDELKAKLEAALPDAERWRDIVENGVPSGEVQWDKEGNAIYHWVLCGPGMELVRFSTLAEAVDARIAARKGKT